MHPAASKLMLLVVAAAAAAACSFSPPAAATAGGATNALEQQLRPDDAGTSCLPHERDALLAFKQGITLDYYGFLASWRRGQEEEEDCCRWRGVTCSNRTGHVVKLDLSFPSSFYPWRGLEGQISPSLLSLEQLESLDLSGNWFDGSIPTFMGYFKNLRYLNLSYMSFTGTFPPNLLYLLLSNNIFSGKFPSWLQSFSTLVFLDLSWNKLEGTIPTWIGELAGLRLLHLSHNMFYGDIPVNITNLKQLQLLNLVGNNLSGSIPLSLSNLIGMTSKHLERLGTDWYNTGVRDSSLDVLSLVIKHQELKYLANGAFHMVGIDLSLNNLTGLIPDGITSLNGLVNLNLSWNQLSGRIPKNIGALKALESFDFSRNNLSGEIPPSLSDLTSLSYLDLSYNNLVGRIPRGRQLDTLYDNDQSMYDGNSGLCGPPFQRNCSGNNAAEHDSQKTSVNDLESRMFFYFGLVSGFVAGLWVVFCAILFRISWRVAYFCQFDKLYDKAYVFVVVTWARFASQATRN